MKLISRLLAFTSVLILAAMADDEPKTYAEITAVCWDNYNSAHEHAHDLLVNTLTDTRDRPLCLVDPNADGNLFVGYVTLEGGEPKCVYQIQENGQLFFDDFEYLQTTSQLLHSAIKSNMMLGRKSGVELKTLLKDVFPRCNEQGEQTTLIPGVRRGTMSVQPTQDKVCTGFNVDSKGNEYLYIGLVSSSDDQCRCVETGARYLSEPKQACQLHRKIGEYVYRGRGWVKNFFGLPLDHDYGVRRSWENCVKFYAKDKETFICSDGKHCVSGEHAKFRGRGFHDDGNECWEYDPGKAETISEDECVR